MSEVEKETVPEKFKNCDNENKEEEDDEESEHDPHYDPIISLPEVEVPTLEEDENIMLSLRAKLYRYDTKETPPEWKERGTGNVKILHHKINDTVRVVIPKVSCLTFSKDVKKPVGVALIDQVMRRDKTLKLCANHFITPFMNLKPSTSCERAWVYSVKDFSDATVKSELLAIKFANIENANKWEEVFEEAKKIVAKLGNKIDTSLDEKNISTNSSKLNDSLEEATKTLSEVNIQEKECSESNQNSN